MQALAGATIVFDLDGTLIDTAPDLVTATNHCIGEIGLPPRPAADLRPWISFGAARMITEALAQSGVPREAMPVDPLLASFLRHYEGNIATHSRPDPGALQALDRLAAAGAKVAVCTNKREELARSLLTALGLAPRFAAIVGRFSLPEHKPHPLHLTGTIALAGGRTEAAVMVGDSAVDVATARAAGVPVAGVTFGYTDTPMANLGPDILIEHYDDLVDALPALLTRT
ncbi:MAG: phosphoglycolate phosphatase [Hyphomicrobiaceae bacterium]